MLRESLQNFQSREDLLKKLSSTNAVDLLVVGGGIHGAAFAHVAALNGLRTVLLEQGDYAQGTSSRSSKMAHGGLRYLEHFDFTQVFEGVKAREELFNVANHICHPEKFLLSVKKKDFWFKFKVGLGLFLYDLFLKNREFRHKWINVHEEEFSPFGSRRQEFQGGFVYTDGILDDTRLVLDTVLAARQEGAICLNYSELTEITPLKEGGQKVKWADSINSRTGELEVGVVVNCAGPWVNEVAGNRHLRSLRQTFRLSRGSHLIFNKSWSGPSLIMPLPEKGRYYFVWPHPAGTLVGTTEREVSVAAKNPETTADEITEILDNVKRDLPDLGLTRENLIYSFAGIRMLPVKRNKLGQKTSQLSRRHKWYFENGILTLVGGKLTTAFRTAFEGLEIIRKLAEIDSKSIHINNRLLPGAGNIKEETTSFIAKCKARDVPRQFVDRAIQRLGIKVNSFIDSNGDDSWFDVVGGICLRGEIEFALRVEQVEKLEDLFLRRLGLEYIAGHGISALDEVIPLLKLARPKVDWDQEKQIYIDKLARMNKLLAQRDS